MPGNNSRVGTISIGMTVSTRKLTQGFREARVEITGFSNGIKQASTNIVTAFSKIALAIGAVVVAAKSLQASVIGPITLAAEAEQTAVAFEVLVGSAKEAQQVISALNKFSDVTPFEPEPVKQAGRQLLAFGVEAKNLLPTLNALGNIAAGIGAPLDELAEIYGKIRVQGRVFAEDINQLQGRGINVTKELAKQLGVTNEEVRELVSEGTIGFVEISKALEALAAGDFADLMKKQSGTVLGLWSTLIGRIKQVGKDFGAELIDTLGIKDILKNAIATLSNVDSLKQFLQPLREFTAQVKLSIGYVQHWYKVLNQDGALTNWIPSLKDITSGMKEWFGILRQAVNTQLSMNKVLMQLASFIDPIQQVSKYLKMLGVDITFTFENAKQILVDFLISTEFALNNLERIWNVAWLGMKVGVYGFMDDMTLKFRQFFATIDLYVQGFRDTIANIPTILENIQGSSIFPWADNRQFNPEDPLGEIFKGTKWDNFTEAEKNYPYFQEFSQATKEANAQLEALLNGRQGLFKDYERFMNQRRDEIYGMFSNGSQDSANEVEDTFADTIGKITYSITNQIPQAWREAAEKIKEGLKTPLQSFEEEFKKLFELRDAGLISDEELGLQSLKILPDTVKDAIEGAKTPIERFKEQGNILKEYFDSGLLSAEQYKIALSKIQEDTFGQQQFAELAEFGSDAAYKAILRNKSRTSKQDPVRQLTEINKQQLNTLNQLPPILRLLTAPPTVVTF
ncbi:tape measure protein [Bremerella sp. P1]|uniref:tape measure protein n=1 Tax=Bremerella sp. P1 TaxID=3026424 RepID=UPI0023688D6E|nr:tape measure protein [Bremerella sp. P1]WDI41821.1 tape measure protein [Bremerella sp. P1]